MGLSFIPLGVGDAFSKKYYSSSILVHSERFTLLVDCPHPIRKMMHEIRGASKPDIGDVDAVVLTHLHADHVSGLEGFLFFSRFHLQKKRTVAAHDDVLQTLWPHHLAGGMGSIHVDGQRKTLTLDEYADTITLDVSRPIQIGPCAISCRRTIHHIPTYALKISIDGVTLGYSADTTYDPTLIDWLFGDSDLVIHETNEGIHTSYEKLKSLPEETRKKMRLIHYPDHFDPKTSAIECLVQGERYSIRS